MKDADEEAIRKMLDNTILDWNRASQLTTIDAEVNYAKLIPAIFALIRQARKNQLREIDEKYLTKVGMFWWIATMQELHNGNNDG